jgi:hypothetical protein
MPDQPQQVWGGSVGAICLTSYAACLHVLVCVRTYLSTVYVICVYECTHMCVSVCMSVARSGVRATDERTDIHTRPIPYHVSEEIGLTLYIP